MTIPTNPQEPFTPFLPSTFNVPEEEDRLRSWLGQKFSESSDVVNDKKIGAYTQATSAQNGEKWSYKSTEVGVRNGFQAIAYIPSYPNTGTLVLTRQTIPQYPIDMINQQFVITLSYGTASKPPTAVGAGNGDFITYMNRGDPRIFWDMSDTTITITTTVDLTLYSGFLVVHFLRNGT